LELNPFGVLAIVALSIVYVWTFYNIPILVAGVRHLRRSSRRREEASTLNMESLPTISIVVPVKDEEKVVGRLLRALLGLDYPPEKREILIVEDGSSDRTVEICMEYVRRYPGQVRLLRKPVSDGKPSALNYALKHARGEILAFFDADNVPEPNILKMVVKYFNDSSVAAVQGRLCVINADENMLTKFVSYEEVAWCEAYLRGKDTLNLFVHLKGSCQFIRRSVLEKMNGFNEEALSEDMELSARLTEMGYRIKYASDVRSWQETPSNIKQVFMQRIRWFRGTMEVAFRYGRLMAKPNRRSLDAELTLIGPFVLIASLVSYFLAFFVSWFAFNFDFLLKFMMQLSAISTTATLGICGIALVYASKPRRISNILWVPFVYFYWSLQAFISLYAMLLFVFHRPKKWLKTDKNGVIANSAYKGLEGSF
jgi:cellulose synthase/poly-beta-1,6-N-acetylglucosamine synthase-like glycosyltransferase